MAKSIIINVPGPQGPVGPQGPQGPQGLPGSIEGIDSLVTTSSFNDFTSSYYEDSASFNLRLDNVNVDTSFLVTTSSFNGFTASYYEDSASFNSFIFKEKRHDYNKPYAYCGIASQNSLESEAVWAITRILVNLDGSTLLASASMVDWTNRYTHVYT